MGFYSAPDKFWLVFTYFYQYLYKDFYLFGCFNLKTASRQKTLLPTIKALELTETSVIPQQHFSN